MDGLLDRFSFIWFLLSMAHVRFRTNFHAFWTIVVFHHPKNGFVLARINPALLCLHIPRGNSLARPRNHLYGDIPNKHYDFRYSNRTKNKEGLKLPSIRGH